MRKLYSQLTTMALMAL